MPLSCTVLRLVPLLAPPAFPSWWIMMRERIPSLRVYPDILTSALRTPIPRACGLPISLYKATTRDDLQGIVYIFPFVPSPATEHFSRVSDAYLLRRSPHDTRAHPVPRVRLHAPRLSPSCLCDDDAPPPNDDLFPTLTLLPTHCARQYTAPMPVASQTRIEIRIKLPLLSAPALVRFLRNVDAARLPPTIRTLNRLWIPTHSIPAGVLLSYGSHLLQCRISHATLLPPSPRRPQTSRGRMTSTVRAFSTFPSSAAAFPTRSNVRAAST
ncbi:hypothetical protein B0H19DRAFT_1273584 [Mycena capillaripes]|nr:hypothetical protein B0H19DRAFT_1273584 [Mycena capillaripes]